MAKLLEQLLVQHTHELAYTVTILERACAELRDHIKGAVYEGERREEVLAFDAGITHAVKTLGLATIVLPKETNHA